MQQKLVCNEVDCSNNRGCLCEASKIHIKGKRADQIKETNCSTYSKDSLMNNVKNSINTNYTGILKQDVFDGEPVHPKIYCDAGKCKYNTNGDCTAKDVQIYSPVNGTNMCNTFELRS